MIIKYDNGLVVLRCDTCGVEHSRTQKHYKNMKKKYEDLFNQDYCNTCWRHILNNRPGYRERMRDSVSKHYSSPAGEITKQKISKALKGVNAGDKNGMKRPEVRKKVSETRTQMMKDPNERLKYRQPSIDAHARGCYIGTKCGQTKWYDYAHSNGTTYKVQGTWELKFIEWLDKNDIVFECHKGRIPFIDHDGVSRNYYPDFFLVESQTYIDIKGDFWFNKSKQKFDTIFAQYPNLKLEIYRKSKLLELGIDV